MDIAESVVLAAEANRRLGAGFAAELAVFSAQMSEVLS